MCPLFQINAFLLFVNHINLYKEYYRYQTIKCVVHFRYIVYTQIINRRECAWPWLIVKTADQLLIRNIPNASDHLSVVANFAIGSLCSASTSQPHTRYRWHAFTRQHLSETYGHSVETLLNEISVPCDNEASQNDINSYYNSIVKSLHKAAEDTVPKIRFSPFLKPIVHFKRLGSRHIHKKIEIS